MKQEAGVIHSASPVNYSYATMRLTRSRIDKGLIAVPMTLATWFPDHNAEIQILLNDSSVAQLKRYSSCNSSTKECRIGGVKRWFEENGLKTGDEIVIQIVDKRKALYRLIPEKDFITKTQKLQADFDDARDEPEAAGKLVKLSEWTNTEADEAALNEYRRLLTTSKPTKRRVSNRKPSRARENTPPSLRTILGRLYQGHCHICDFWFLRRSKEPYFEVHHIDPAGGHYPKNLVLVCGNCHNQFEHAEVLPPFNHEQWLVSVRFNSVPHQVNQIGLRVGLPDFAKELFV